MKILGIDPGSRKTGWGLIESKNNGRVVEWIAHGILHLDTKKDVIHRLGELAVGIQSLLKKFDPDEAAIEDVFFSKNARSALVLGQARGSVLGVLGCADIPVKSLTPAEVKQAITGSGRGSKDQIQSMVQIILKLDEKAKEDASDALAVAVTASRLSGIFGLGIAGKSTIPKSKKQSARASLLALAQRQGKRP